MIERDIERKLTAGIRRIGGVAYKFTSPGHTGVPDRLVLLPGGVVKFVELKTTVGRVSPVQSAQIRRIRALGFDVRVLHGADEVEEFLKEVESEVRSA